MGVRASAGAGVWAAALALKLRRGVPLEVVSEKLGHSRPSFKADVYRTVYQSEHEEWAVNLSDLTSKREKVVN